MKNPFLWWSIIRLKTGAYLDDDGLTIVDRGVGRKPRSGRDAALKKTI
jgi:hypothetical protein